MKTFKRETFEKNCREGRFEAVTDVNRFGRVDVRWVRTGRVETVTVAG